MKQLSLILFLSICFLPLVSCQSANEEMTLLDNVSSVSISESDGYGGLNEHYFTTIEQGELTSEFEEVIKHANSQTQAVSNQPDYDILVRYENGETHGLHLILGNEGQESTLMYIGHESEGYIVSSESTEVLRKMLDEFK
ncbi:hypothetical protein [Gracilibacillus salinarum]|uniref:Lipoprotein n=1 Tax=Gracilibacillus salinarum TaxID=2932255 RepID=A0ABY4GJ79_9BACI|nr:hypothetical protein [Gracilibacillus salinarum]UOQ83527.1 hypothetical protein MUN87_12240 [Gracilibacillus salinarum]